MQKRKHWEYPHTYELGLEYPADHLRAGVSSATFWRNRMHAPRGPANQVLPSDNEQTGKGAWSAQLVIQYHMY